MTKIGQHWRQMSEEEVAVYKEQSKELQLQSHLAFVMSELDREAVSVVVVLLFAVFELLIECIIRCATYVMICA